LHRVRGLIWGFATHLLPNTCKSPALPSVYGGYQRGVNLGEGVLLGVRHRLRVDAMLTEMLECRTAGSPCDASTRLVRASTANQSLFTFRPLPLPPQRNRALVLAPAVRVRAPTGKGHSASGLSTAGGSQGFSRRLQGERPSEGRTSIRRSFRNAGAPAGWGGARRNRPARAWVATCHPCRSVRPVVLGEINITEDIALPADVNMTSRLLASHGERDRRVRV